jgi:hypothetical protein
LSIIVIRLIGPARLVIAGMGRVANCAIEDGRS